MALSTFLIIYFFPYCTSEKKNPKLLPLAAGHADRQRLGNNVFSWNGLYLWSSRHASLSGSAVHEPWRQRCDWVRGNSFITTRRFIFHLSRCHFVVNIKPSVKHTALQTAGSKMTIKWNPNSFNTNWTLWSRHGSRIHCRAAVLECINLSLGVPNKLPH